MWKIVALKIWRNFMENKPLLSVIVPIYNVEEYLEKCLDSIINQTYKNLEIILVDDGSPDKCPQICDEYAKKDDRIVVIHKENGGVSSARNLGLDIAKGEFITFVDSDDWIDETMYEKMMLKQAEENLDLVFTRYKTIKNGSIKKIKELTMDIFCKGNDLQYFISQLDDNIEIIGVDELLSAIEQNVPHEFAQPE